MASNAVLECCALAAFQFCHLQLSQDLTLLLHASLCETHVDYTLQQHIQVWYRSGEPTLSCACFDCRPWCTHWMGFWYPQSRSTSYPRDDDARPEEAMRPMGFVLGLNRTVAGSGFCDKLIMNCGLMKLRNKHRVLLNHFHYFYAF